MVTTNTTNTTTAYTLISAPAWRRIDEWSIDGAQTDSRRAGIPAETLQAILRHPRVAEFVATSSYGGDPDQCVRIAPGLRRDYESVYDTLTVVTSASGRVAVRCTPHPDGIVQVPDSAGDPWLAAETRLTTDKLVAWFGPAWARLERGLDALTDDDGLVAVDVERQEMTGQVDMTTPLVVVMATRDGRWAARVEVEVTVRESGRTMATPVNATLAGAAPCCGRRFGFAGALVAERLVAALTQRWGRVGWRLAAAGDEQVDDMDAPMMTPLLRFAELLPRLPWSAPQITATRGLPGSGKTTWAKEVARPGSRWTRANRDDLRLELFGQLAPLSPDPAVAQQREEQVTALQRERIRAAITTGKSVVVDDTNTNPARLEALRSLAQNLGARFLVREFPMSAAAAIARQAGRPAAERVPAEVILRMAAQAPDITS